MTDVPAERDAQRPTVVAVVAGLVLCALAAYRQAERDALRLGDAAQPSAPALPRTLIVPRSPMPSSLPPPPAAPTPDVVSPAAPPAASVDRASLEALGVETFSEQRHAIRECLMEERARRPDAGGKLEVRVDVDARGFVSGVTLGDSPVRSPSFDECVALSAAQLVFPTELAGRDVAITFDLR